MAAIVTCDTLRVRIWLCQSRAGAKTHPVLVRFRASHWLRMIEFSRFFEPESLGYKPPGPGCRVTPRRKFEQRWHMFRKRVYLQFTTFRVEVVEVVPTRVRLARRPEAARFSHPEPLNEMPFTSTRLTPRGAPTRSSRPTQAPAPAPAWGVSFASVLRAV